ncbi:hypothetical protein F6X37_27390 [Paraburkholderia sp. 31.1]|uniref:hypothetical protein n=1 Tax=Paraburkholderia sp. 31.1 TaxID=2615205 RepID=UPI001655F5A3|nr:hypothetical protein [Paraburkholderia sp. 31.1]MBC8725168.1 hypothetical protein [Paraburkholderia sp. 31.1]
MFLLRRKNVNDKPAMRRIVFTFLSPEQHRRSARIVFKHRWTGLSVAASRERGLYGACAHAACPSRWSLPGGTIKRFETRWLN